METSCPLCTSHNSTLFCEDGKRHYLRCGRCQLVFVPRRFFLSATEEKAQYDLHENNPDDPGYRAFLSRLSEPLSERLSAHSRGLDFGCGPGPALPEMLAEQGHRVARYDVFYANDPQLLRQRYDFITATEVIEHLHNPRQVIAQWLAMLAAGGVIGLMTKLVIDAQRFANWHYKNDPTHVCFYSKATFRWLARHWALDVSFVGADVILLSRR